MPCVNHFATDSCVVKFRHKIDKGRVFEFRARDAPRSKRIMACFRLVLLLVASRRSDALQPTVNKIVGQLGVGSGGGTTDVILSSGFCCFSSHCGFLDALEASPLSIGALVGTSSGSLAASLYACGLSAEAVAAELAAKAPVREWA